MEALWKRRPRDRSAAVRLGDVAVYQWKQDPADAIRAIEKRRGRTREASALAFWARMSVESLHYLADMDDAVAHGSTPFLDHKSEIVDMANVYAATATAFAALDRCAGVLGQLYVHKKKPRNQTSLAQLRPWSHRKDTEKRRAKLPADGRRWVRGVWIDLRYQKLKELRHPLTHHALNRTLVVTFGEIKPHETRMSLRRHKAPSAPHIDSREIIVEARDSATEHVEAFFALVTSGKI
jgi:hypothetical protein